MEAASAAGSGHGRRLFVAGVSATTFVDEKNTPYFKGFVRLSRNHLGHRVEDHPVLPGMTVVCDIVTDRKTVLQYLARPVATAFRQGLPCRIVKRERAAT